MTTKLAVVVLALLLAACAAHPAGPAPTLAPAYALQDALATGTAAARAIEATATAQVNYIATEARASVALAEMQTQAAIPGQQTATAIANAVLIATATEGAVHNATRAAATLSADTQARERQTFDANVWLIVGSLSAGAAALSLCIAVLKVGRAYENKVKAGSIVIIRNETDSPIGYFLPGPVPRYHSLTGGHPLAIEAEPDIERQCRDAWRRAVRDVARDAAEAGSWSVNALCRRGHSRWAEDTVIRAQAIAAEIGALVNRGGSRGWGYADTWDYVTLAQALDGGALFTLPRTPAPDGQPGVVVWPVLPGQSEAKQSEAKQTSERKLSHAG